MDLAHLILLVLQLSIGLIVACVAMRASPGDLRYLLSRPSLLIRSLLAMNVLTPILAVAIAASCKLNPQLEVALILLAVSPVPPVLPGKQGKAGGSVSYAVGLLMIAALLAIVTVPLSVNLIGRFFGRDVSVPMPLIAKVVGMSVILPLILGTIVRRSAPSFAARFAEPISKVGTILLLLGVVPFVFKSWHAIVGQIGNFTLVAIVLFVVASLLVGHLLGGPDPDDRTVLGLATATRHPGVAMTIAGAIGAPENRPAVTGALLLTVLVSAIVTGFYVKWRKRGHAALGTPIGTPAR
jgi:predicted Na+-dependent transporter